MPKEYQLLPAENETENNDVLRFSRICPLRTHRFIALYIFGTLLLLIVSIVLNCILILRSQTLSSTYNEKSTYAGIPSNNVPKAIYPHAEYVNDNNLTATTVAWEALSGDPGVVALHDNFVASKNLPKAMRFPWDHSKGVYLLQGFHNLHCLRTIYRSIIDYHYQRPQRIALVHILHCLDELRQDVICNADDTPRYAGFQDPPGTGQGQVKMCREWNKLEQWALKNTACFQHEDETPDRMVNRFKFCPDGQILWPVEES